MVVLKQYPIYSGRYLQLARYAKPIVTRGSSLPRSPVDFHSITRFFPLRGTAGNRITYRWNIVARNDRPRYIRRSISYALLHTVSVLSRADVVPWNRIDFSHQKLRRYETPGNLQSPPGLCAPRARVCDAAGCRDR